MRILTLLTILISAVVMLTGCPANGLRFFSADDGQPLPARSTLTYEAYETGYEKFLAAWLHSIRKKHVNPAIDAEVDSLLEASATYRARTKSIDNKALQRLLDRCQKLLQQDCRDPLVLSLHGDLLHRLGRSDEAKPLLIEAVSQLETNGYPAFARHAAATTLHAVYKQRPPEQDIWPQLNERARLALAEAASDPIFSNGNQRYYLQAFYDYWGRHRHIDERSSLIEALADVERIDPWLRHMINGEHHYALAWQARGGGWSQSVKQGGMELFEEEMALARAELVAAHELHPEFPEAATCMIIVRMASAGPVSEREWFDRAVAAQFDYLTAYDNLLWSLMPRWGGSHEKIYDFGRECLDTGRFDTRVPSRFVHAVHLIATDLDDPKEVYRRPGVYPLLQKTFENALNSPQLSYRYNAYRTHYVLVAWLAGDYEQSARMLNELDGELDAEIVEYYDLYPRQVRGDLQTVTGQWGNTTRLGRSAEDKGEFAAALARYLEVLNNPEQPSEQIRFAWQRICCLPFTQDEDYSLRLARVLETMGLRELILLKYRSHLESSGRADKQSVFYNSLARQVGRHNLDFVELLVNKSNLLKEEVAELNAQIETLPFEPTPQFSPSAFAIDRELALLRVLLIQDFSSATKDDFKEQMAPRMQHLADNRMLLEFVLAHLRDGRLSGTKQWNLAANYFATSAYRNNFDFNMRQEAMARLRNSASDPELLAQVGVEGRMYGSPVLFLQMANLCRERGAWQESRNLRNLSLDWHQLHAVAMNNTPWVSYQALVSLAMVEGYELEAIEYGELAVDSKYCITGNLLTAHALIRLNRIDEAAKMVARNPSGQLRQGGHYCLPDRTYAEYPDLLGALITELLTHPDLSAESRLFLMDAFKIKLN